MIEIEQSRSQFFATGHHHSRSVARAARDRAICPRPAALQGLRKATGERGQSERGWIVYRHVRITSKPVERIFD